MTGDQEKTLKRDVIERFNEAKGRLQQSVPETRHLIKVSDVVETVRKIIDPKNIEKVRDGLKKLADANLPQGVIKQAVSDFQLKDLIAKAEALVAKTNLTVAKMFSKETFPGETATNETSSNETAAKKARLKKGSSKRTSVKKSISKRKLSKKKTKQSVKRK
jgi:hypothetical protein